MTHKRKRTNIGAIPILRDWATSFRPYTMLTLCALLFLAQGTYAYVGPVTLNLTPDNYGSETTWKIIDSSDTIIAEGGPYENGNTTPIEETIDLLTGTGYTLAVYDSEGDGFCCDYGNGSYSLTDAEGTEIASGGDFGSDDSTQFDILSTVLTITGTPATNLVANQAYSFTPTVFGAEGSALTFSINPQPSWANFDTSTGALTGTPIASGTTTGIVITVSNTSAKIATLAAFDIAVRGAIYVKHDATGNNDGTSWTNAYTDLQTALTDTTIGEIWVAKGVYKATSGTDRTATFQLKNGVALYGGFAGNEISREERNWNANKTVLSGDIDNNDTTDTDGIITVVNNISGDNVYTVVTGSGTDDTAILDGFVITGGLANGSSDSPNPDSSGAGIFNNAGSPTLVNLVVIGNTAHDGGGMYNTSSSPTLTNIIFYNNFAESYGGGIGNYESSNLTLTNVTISGNDARSFGDGIYNVDSNSIFKNVIVWANAASDVRIANLQILNLNATLRISNSLIQDSCASIKDAICGEGNITHDPLFVDERNGDLRLSRYSPAIDIGDNEAITSIPKDLEGNTRIFNDKVDMGAYEYDGSDLRATGLKPNVALFVRRDSINPFNGIDFGTNSIPTFADLDKDGDFDAVIGTEGEGENVGVYYYENTGTNLVEKTGTDNPFDGITSGYDNSPALVDIDNDGDLDVFLGNRLGTLLHYKNTGTSSSPTFVVQNGSNNPLDAIILEEGNSVPSFVDIDKDGDFDVFVNESSGKLYPNYYENIGTAISPTFVKRLETDNPLKKFTDIFAVNSKTTFVDIDHDGDFDAFIGEHDYSVFYYENTGTARHPYFVPQISPFADIRDGKNNAPTFVDWDQDGDKDAFIGKEDGTISYYENFGQITGGRFFNQAIAIIFEETSLGKAIAPSLVDIDNDGDLDIFIGENDGVINYYKNTGTPDSPLFVVEEIEGTNPFDGIDVGSASYPAFADIDDDGDFDAFVRNISTIKYYQNTGTATDPLFETGATNPLDEIHLGITGLMTPSFVDLDQDGDLDALIGCQDSGSMSFIGCEGISIYYYKNEGTRNIPNFVKQTGINNPFNQIGVFFGSPNFIDFDNDGDIDMFVGEHAGTIHYFENTGTASVPKFLARTDAANPFVDVELSNYSTPFLADIDNDGNLDAIIGDFYSNFLRHYEHTNITNALPRGGNYNFTPQVYLQCFTCDKFYYTVDGSTPTRSSTQYVAPIAIPANTTTILKYIRVEDGVASEVTTETYFVDTQPPTVALTTPEDKDELARMSSIKGTAADATGGIGVDYVELQITNGSTYLTEEGSFVLTPTWVRATGTDDWTYDTGGISFPPGDYTITARAFDKLENRGIEKSITVGIGKGFSELYLESSSATILNSDTLDLVGKLNRFPETGEDLSGKEIVLTITAPDGQRVTQTTTTHTNTGQFKFEDLSLPALFDPMLEGAFGFKATFAGDSLVLASESGDEAVLVGASAGYAILVQGKIANEEGLAAHNKTIHRSYHKLIERGFEDDNIKYFNYNTAQDGVDGLPLKSDIEAAFTELKDRLSSNPAPFYVIMIDHGGSDGTFHIYNDNDDAFDDVIKPAELASWLDHLEDGLSDTVLAKPRLIILGACYSGSFIPEVSGEGRIIVTSATASEESYKGPEEPDGIRSGEYFMEEFFGRLGKGDNVKAAFEYATERTELLTRRGDSSTNTTNRFRDQAVQHPLLDDNGDSKGSNTLATDGDGVEAAKVLLGVGINYDTNSSGNPAEIIGVSDSLYLTALESAASLVIQVNDANRINSAVVDIRPPSVQLSSTGTEQSEQLELPDLKRAFLGCDGQTHRCTTYFDQFTSPGKYEAFYFVRDTKTKDISPIKRSVIYKDEAGNTPPNGFDLVLPADDSEQKTVVLFNWETTTDPDNQAVTYRLILSEEEEFGTVAYIQEELTDAMSFLDETAVMKNRTLGLKDKTTYYWKVEAVDPFGARTASSSVFSFTTNNTNKPPSHVNLNVENHTDSQPVSNVQIDYYRADTQVTPDAHVQDQGRALTQIESGQYTVNVTADGYEPQQFQVDTRTGSIDTIVALTPTNPIMNYGQLQLAVNFARIGEAQGTVNLLVKRGGGSDGTVSVDYATADGSATTGSDYTAQSGTLTWSNYDEGAKPINLPITDDSDFEGDETFTVTLSNPTGGATLGTINQLSVTIVENDQPKPGVLQFSAPTMTANEGDTTLNLTVTRTEGRDGEVSVQYLANGTATVGTDYIGESGTLTWASGDDTPKSLNLQLIDDTEVEATETLTLRLLDPTGDASLGSQTQATLSITDNDVPQQPGTLQFTEPTYTADEGAGELSLTVTRVGGSDGEVSVQYLVTGGSTATADSDYTGGSGTLTWPPGDTSPKPLPITIIDDSDSEPTETIQFTLSNPTAATLGSQVQATLSLIDNDAPATPSTLQFAEPTYTAGEGDGELSLTVTRVGGTDGEVSVQYLATGGSTATADSDYTGGSGTLTWPAGDSSPKPLPITMIDDSVSEELETIQFTLSNPTGATLGSPAQAALSIIDNDAAPSVLKAGILQFAEATYTANESDGELNITVIRTGGSDGQVTVPYNTTGSSTATVDSDYTGSQGTLTWDSGDMTAKSLTLNIINDSQVEGTELVTLVLGTPTGGATLGSPVHATVTLADNDVSTPVTPPDVITPEPETPATQSGVLQFAAATYSANESDGEFNEISVTRTGGSDGSVSVQYLATVKSTATADRDYTGTDGMLTWAEGDTEPKPLTVALIDDEQVEETETVNFTLSNPTDSATLGNQTTATLSITDNDTAAPVSPAGSLQFSAPTYLVKETEGELDNILVTRNGGNSGSVSVEYLTTGDSTATAGYDYTGASGTLTWADGDSEPKPLTLTLKDDDQLEPAETIHLKLFEATGEAELGSPAGAKLVIVDNEGDPLASLGQGFAIGCPDDVCSVTTQFRGGSTNETGPDYQATLSIPASQRVLVRGEMEVDAAHVGQPADLLVVIYSQPLEESQTDQFLMVDSEQQQLEWAFLKDGNINLAALVAAYQQVTLTETQPVALYQGVLSTQKAHLLIYFGYRLQDSGQIVFNGSLPLQVRIGLDNELPSLGNGSAIFCPNDDCPPLTTTFKGGASVNEQDYQSTLTLSPTQLVKILGQIEVDAAHVDQKADILVLAGLTLAGEESTGELFFMLDNQKRPLLWDFDLEKLVAAVSDITLAASVPVEIYQGGLVEGQLRIYFGYRLENGMIVFNGEQTINLPVVQPKINE